MAIGIGLSTQIGVPLGILICRDEGTMIDEVFKRDWDTMELNITEDFTLNPIAKTELENNTSFFVPNEDIDTYLDY